MTASLFGTSVIEFENLNVAGTLVPESFVATAGQTLFTLVGFTYVVGTDSLVVFQNGKKLCVTRDYVETSSSSFTLNVGASINDQIDVLGFPQIDLSAVTAANVALGGGYTLADYLNDSIINIAAYPYLADGTGVNDSTTVIQAALNTGLAIYLPPGQTFIYSTLSVTDGNRILSDGGTLKRKATSGLSSGEIYTIDATNADNFEMHGVIWDGNRNNQSGSAGFKVSGVLIRNGTNINVSGNIIKNWHEDCIEATCAVQQNPINAYTAPADRPDTNFRLIIAGNHFQDCGRNVDDGSGYANSRAIQLGSIVVNAIVTGNTVWNCIGFCQAGSYNRYLTIANNTGYIDSTTYTYASSFVAVEQLSKTCSVVNNIGYGWREHSNIESIIGGVVTDNVGGDVVNGISAFASNIGAVLTDLGDVVISNNRMTCRSTTTGTFAIRVVLSSGNAAYDCIIVGNKTSGAETGLSIYGLDGGIVTSNYSKGNSTGIVVNDCTDILVVGNEAKDNTIEGMYFGASNDGVTVTANKSTGNAYGCYVAAGQTNLSIHGNDFVGNSTTDFLISTYSTNNVNHWNNDYATQSGTIKTLSGATPSLAYVGPICHLTNAGATTVTSFSAAKIGRIYGFITTDANTTLQHGAGIKTNTGANIVLAANRAVHLFSNDGTTMYQP